MSRRKRVLTDEQRKAIGQRLLAGRQRKAKAAAVTLIPEPPPAPPMEVTYHAIPPDPPKVLTWKDLPRDVRKCARSRRIPDDAPVFKMRCTSCRAEMWSRSQKWEDICETCEYVLITEKHQLQQAAAKRRAGRLINPLRQETPNPIPNPLGRAGRLF
jgi:hypothetical protein